MPRTVRFAVTIETFYEIQDDPRGAHAGRMVWRGIGLVNGKARHLQQPELDRAVDRYYRREAFPSDRARVEYLFGLYEQLTAPLLPVTKAKRGRRG